MKKVVLAAIAVFAFGATNAQDLRFGVKAGPNFASLTGDAVGDDVTAKVGFHVGGLVEIKFTEKFAFQPELVFSMQGAKAESTEEEDFFSSNSEDKITLSYINLPLMVKYYAADAFFIEGGPQVGFLVSANAKSEGSSSITIQTGIDGDGNPIFTTTSTSFETDEDVKDQYKSIDFGFNIGVGYDFTENLFVNARYNIGLSNIADFGDVNDIEIDALEDLEYDAKNSVISLSVGYKF